MNRNKIAARNIKIAPDITVWTNLKTLGIESVKTSEIFNVRFIERGKGALEGFGIGFLGGASLGIFSGIVGGDNPHGLFTKDALPRAIIGGISIGIVGGILGIPAGTLAGSENIYYLQN